MKTQAAIIALFVATLYPAHADVSLPAIFGDHMVLQGGVEVPVWGWADPGEKIEVSVGSVRARTEADASGRWKVKLGPLQGNGDPVTMRVAGNNTVSVQDVLVGDVWLCSGQSNMAFMVKEAHNAAEAVPSANYPQIRLFTVPRKAAFSPQENCGGKWQVCTPETVAGFSAVSYFFSRELYDLYKKPMGLIDASWGGTAAEAWTGLEKLESVPELHRYAEGFKKAKDGIVEAMQKYQTETLPAWKQAAEKWNREGRQGQGPGRQPPPPDNNHRVPTVLFNGLIAPLIPYAIKGILWYQGENNSGPQSKAEEYAILFPALISDWRTRWGQGDFPFLYVQLAGFARPGPDSGWCILRNVQFKTLKVPNTAMAVTVDIGEKSIHPLNKLDVGKRLALAARKVAYGEDIVYSGPLFKSIRFEGGRAIVSFDHVGGGLVIGVAPPIRLDEPPKTPADELHGFEIAAADGAFHPAKAEIRDGEVVVWNDTVTSPAQVRYAWTGIPEPMANLYNKEGLPASPFHSGKR